MVKLINSLKNYLLERSNSFRYYKSENLRLNQDIIKLEDQLKTLTFNSGGHPPGHFYSPINDVEFLKEREEDIWKPELLEGMKLNEDEQINFYKSVMEYHADIPFKSTKQSNLRYYFDNGFFEHSDGTILYSVIRKIKPKKIIEIGSGFSSALMMDVNDLFFEKGIELTFIEPYPERLFSLMSNKDKTNYEVITNIVQDVDLEKFKELEANDILFIDSSHVVKTGSDVKHILFKILPILKSGVYIHFHDIFYPYEYPKVWILNNQWNWNEDYFLIAFLMYNYQFKIILSPPYLFNYHKETVQKIPGPKIAGGSIWLKKM